jgi:hypothetical protein
LAVDDTITSAPRSALRRTPTARELTAWPDAALLDALQHAAFQYFPLNSNPRNGLVADTSRNNSPCSIAVIGFALAAYPIAVERGWIGRTDATHRVLAALRFFHACDQSGSSDATGYKGFYYHFLDMQSGRRVWRSELSMVDTTLLIAGALTAASYFTGDNAAECELRLLAEALYLRIDWCWAQDRAPTMRMGWKPESGFLHYGWEGFSESILMYVLAMGSPTHPVLRECYAGWTSTYQWENLYGYDYLYAGPLFVHQFSHAWIDFRDIRDRFMQEKGSDYFENSRRATFIQREYAIRNPNQFTGYDANGWGLSACDGPARAPARPSGAVQPAFGYAARGVPYGPDDGTLSVPSVLASLPFAPDIALEAVRNLLARYPEVLSGTRLSTGLNPTLSDQSGSAWVSAGDYGLDQGIIAMMIENHRSGFPWQLMRACPHIRLGLQRAGFHGGWLEQSPTGGRP